MNEPQPEDPQLPTPFELSMIAAQFYSPLEGGVDEQDHGVINEQDHGVINEQDYGDADEYAWTPRSNPAHAALAALTLWQACDQRLRDETKSPWPTDIPRPRPEDYPLDFRELLKVMPEDMKNVKTKRQYLDEFLDRRTSHSIGSQRREDRGIRNEWEWRRLATALKAWAPEHQLAKLSERGKKGAAKRHSEEWPPVKGAKKTGK